MNSEANGTGTPPSISVCEATSPGACTTASMTALSAASITALSAASMTALSTASMTALSATGLSVNVGAAISGLLAADSACSTPRTPEILNSLIAMTSPLDEYPYGSRSTTAGYKGGSESNSSNGSPASSPANGSPPSIQKTCSDLIKAGLKLQIQSKRKMSSSDSSEICLKRPKKEEPIPSDEEYDSSHTNTSRSEGLTAEDEERRRRRRERNKIAATKCRLKKRERTVNLVTESEILENQNIDLKTQLQELQAQSRQLVDMLNVHSASCVKGSAAPTPVPASYSASPAYHTSPSPYLRPESADVLASSYATDTCYARHQLDDYARPDSLPSMHNVYDAGCYLQKSDLLVIEPTDDYQVITGYDNMVDLGGYQTVGGAGESGGQHSQQQLACHYGAGGDQQKMNNSNNSSLNNGCLA